MTAFTPALFVGHGNPMNAITPNAYRAAWASLAVRLPKPRAVLCVSAHWETASPQVCIADRPRTIHDFHGFPPELFAQQYPAPGAPELGQQVQALLGAGAVALTSDWGLDHGAWCPLQSFFPQADVPVAQLSLARTFTPSEHFDFAKRLAPLRRAGVMILCSGNVVHNLRMLGTGAAPAWAREFDDYVARAVLAGDDDALIAYSMAGAGARLAVPTPEHYLPLLYAVAVRQPGDRASFFVDGFDLGSVSMRSLLLESPAP